MGYYVKQFEFGNFSLQEYKTEVTDTRTEMAWQLFLTQQYFNSSVKEAGTSLSRSHEVL